MLDYKETVITYDESGQADNKYLGEINQSNNLVNRLVFIFPGLPDATRATVNIRKADGSKNPEPIELTYIEPGKYALPLDLWYTDTEGDVEITPSVWGTDGTNAQKLTLETVYFTVSETVQPDPTADPLAPPGIIVDEFVSQVIAEGLKLNVTDLRVKYDSLGNLDGPECIGSIRQGSSLAHRLVVEFADAIPSDCVLTINAQRGNIDTTPPNLRMNPITSNSSEFFITGWFTELAVPLTLCVRMYSPAIDGQQQQKTLANFTINIEESVKSNGDDIPLPTHDIVLELENAINIKLDKMILEAQTVNGKVKFSSGIEINGEVTGNFTMFAGEY